MGKYVDFYCSNNNKELKKIIDPVLVNKFGWIPQRDYDDFYSVAACVVWDCEKRFDKEKVKNKKFKSFLSSCIYNKIKSQLTHMHRDKRCLKDKEGNPVYTLSIDAPVDDEGDYTLGETIAGSFDMEKEIFKDKEEVYSESMVLYLDRLSHLQKAVLELIAAGYQPHEIMEELLINEKQYSDCIAAIHSYRNISIFLENRV